MSFDRTLLFNEPGRITFKTQYLYSQGAITVKPVMSLAEIATSVHGVVARGRVTNRMFTVSGVLAGEWEALAELFHGMGKAPGQSLFESTDTPMVINGIHGNQLTLVNACITKPPVIIGRAGSTLFGAFEAMAICGKDLDPSLAASYFALATVSYPGDAAFDRTKMITLPLSAVWGASSPWDDFATMGGWTITPTMTVTMSDVDGHGTVDIKLRDSSVTAVATPAGITRAQLYAKCSFGGGLGASREGGDDLVLSAAGVYVALTDAVITDANSAFGAEETVVGEVTWTAQRKWSAGAMVPLITVDTEAPE